MDQISFCKNITENALSKFWTAFSNIIIFILWLFFNLANCSNKWKRFCAVSVNWFFVSCGIFCQVSTQNFILHNVSFWFDFDLHFLKLKSKSLMICWSLSTTKSLNPFKPNESNENKLIFGWISNKLHQCVPGSLSLSVSKIAKRYLEFLCLIVS